MAEVQGKRPERRSAKNFFVVEQGFKQRQILRLLGLSLLNVLVSTVAFVVFMKYELAAAHSGLPMPSLVRIGIVWAAFMGGVGGLFALFTGMLMAHRTAGPIYKFKSELEREIGVKPPWALESFEDPYVDILQSLQRLRLSPFLVHKDHIRGFVYDVTTGELAEVTPER